MNKKWIWFSLTIGILTALCFVAGDREIEDQLPPMIMVDGILYQLDGDWHSEPAAQPDGTIREFIGNRIPGEHEQANFGDVGMPYWKVQEGICVYVNDNYLLFKNQE